jgi:quercetin dioxygenase-like cupin family protein
MAEKEHVFSEMIKSMPEVDVPVEGVRGWLLSGGEHQAVFFEIEQTAVVPPHSHCAQWGIVVEGEMELTICGEKAVYRRGDRYTIGAGVEHGARFLSKVYVIDVFGSPDRYKAKE